MPSILSYSGICTKVRAMHGRLIRPAQYQHLINCSTLADAVAYLKELPAYAEILKDYDENTSRRGTIEPVLTSSLYHDFNRLYLFAGPKQEQFLDLYLMHYEVQFLKDCLHSAFAGTDSLTRPAYYREFFNRRSKLRFDELVSSRSIEDFISALEGTRYHAPLCRIHESSFNTLFDYETGFDQFYFSSLWKSKESLLSRKEIDIITENYGTRIDLLNIQWIMRAKQFYHMSDSELYALIIPCYYRIKPDDIRAMTEASNTDELEAAIASTYYGKRYEFRMTKITSVEKMYIELLEHIYDLSARKHPYSAAPIYAYLYEKEHEINRITSIIEGIRYGLSAKELETYIIH